MDKNRAALNIGTAAELEQAVAQIGALG